MWYCRFSLIRSDTPIAKTIRTSHAPSVNFTIAKTRTTISDVSPAAKLIARLCRQPRSFWTWWYLAMPNPAIVNAVNTPSA